MGVPLLQLAEVIDGRWRATIGDPSLYGWLTVIAYIWAAAFCLLCARWASRLCPGRGRRRWVLFWGALGLGLGFMAVNKQLDLQGLMVVWAKRLAQEQGWYEQRRVYQRQFIYAVAAGGAVTVVVLLLAMRGMLRRTWLAILGVGVVLGFVLIRAASFHFVDRFLGVRLGGVAYNWLLEWCGILLVSAGALMNLLGTPPSPEQARLAERRAKRKRERERADR